MQEDLLSVLGASTQQGNSLAGSVRERSRLGDSFAQSGNSTNTAYSPAPQTTSSGSAPTSATMQKLVAFAVLLVLATLLFTGLDLRTAYRALLGVTRQRSNLQRVAGFIVAYLAAGRVDLAVSNRHFDLRWLVAVLTSVFAYKEACVVVLLVAALCFIEPLWVRPKDSRSTVSNLATAVMLVVQTALMRTTWYFYRDVFSLLLAHSGKRSTAAYCGCGALFFLQVMCAVSVSVYIGQLVHEFMSASTSLSSAAQRAGEAVRAAFPATVATASVALTVVSVYALNNNFPQTKSYWFW
eukprot:TRINITY_DN25486_c0_g1_i1.p2 TRINITY_DN25486_c0_g1~~TRINITY_DN25486_c0_g1_i1.p2  ORF type:complete len:296 (+),score=105.73 TRINITY_DN25486_c0_g1_i1:180-1067(+)